jgi:RNA polymerase sigma-70 factor (ECF subfamily)
VSLIALLARHASPTRLQALARMPELERSLRRLLDEGRARFPELALADEPFMAFMARQLSPESVTAESLAALRGADLYLACAYGLGNEKAQHIVESELISAVRQSLRYLDTPEPAICEILQGLREHLRHLQDSTSERRAYSGCGELLGWLRITALRKAGLVHKRLKSEQRLEQSAEEVLRLQRRDAGAELLTQRYKKEFQEAFGAALFQLSSRERNLLRYFFLSSLSVESIARLYLVHVSIAARWLSDAQQHLAQKTREHLLRVVPLHEGSLNKLSSVIESQLSLHLSNLLEASHESETVGKSNAEF